jgi:hypothetical protein
MRIDEPGRGPSKENLKEMPTAVIPTIEQGTRRWLVGEEATIRGAENPLFKLEMGKMNTDGEMSEINVDSPDRELIKDLNLRPEYLAAKLMAELRNKIIGRKRHDLAKIGNVTVTVPWESTFLQREATRFSAKVAGWDNMVTLPEPVAAFLYFKQYRQELLENAEYFLVFDFGGGTCDISILGWPDKNSLPYVITGSGARIGGEDIDECLWKQVGRTALDEKRLNNLSRAEKAKVREITKQLKENLNPNVNPNERTKRDDQITSNESLYIIEEGRFIEGFSLSIADLDEVVNNKVKPKITQALDTAIKRARDIEEDKFRIDRLKVLMIGGSSHLWIVQDFMEAYFGKKYRNISFRKGKITIEEPMHAVAYGAALHQYYRLRSGSAINLPLSADIYIRYQKDNKRNRNVVWDKAYLGRRAKPLPIPNADLIRIERMPSQIWHSLDPLRLPSNLPPNPKDEKRKISWPIYKDSVEKDDLGRSVRREKVATINIDDYSPGPVTYLRIAYRINEYGDLDLLRPYLINDRDYKVDGDLTRGDYKCDNQFEEEIREEMNI